MSTEVSEAPSTTTTTAKKGTGKRPAKRPSTGGDDASAASSSSAAPKVKKSNRAAKAESSAPVHTEEKPEITPLPEHMDPPSEAEYKNQLTKLDGELKTICDKIDRLVGGAIQQKIEERRSAHEGFLQLLEKVKAIRANRQALFEEGNKYKAQLDSVTGGRQAQKAKLQGIEKELKYKNLDDLEAAIKDLEYKVQTTTMPLAAEKKHLDEIRRLKNQRETVAHFSKEREAFRETKVDTTDVRQAMGKAFEGAKAFKAEEEKLSKELDALKEKEKAAEKAIADFHEQKTALQEKRKEINKTINRTHIAHEKALRLYQKWQNFQSKKAREAEREKKKEEWEKKKADREKAKQEYEERKKRREERQKEWEERKKQQTEERALAKAFYEEQKRMEAELKEAEDAAKDPWEKEKFMCDDIEKYLKRLAGEKIDMNEETKSDVDSDLKLVKAEERMNDFKGKSVKAEVQNKGKKLPEHALFALKKKEAKLEAQKKAAEKTKPADRVLTHVPFTLASFRSIQIDPPKFLSEVAATLKAVQERREYYNTAPRPDKKKKNQSTIEEVDHAIAADHALTESENDDNRTKSAAMADQLAEEERQRQISEEEAVIEEEKKEREEARRKSIAASELEQLRRVQEIAEQKAAAATEEQEERKKNQELADLAFEKEKADRIAADELAVKQAEDERVANQAIANELEDKEKARRIAEEKSNSEQVAELKEKARKLSVDLVNSDALKQMVEKQENKREPSE